MPTHIFSQKLPISFCRRGVFLLTDNYQDIVAENIVRKDIIEYDDHFSGMFENIVININVDFDYIYFIVYHIMAQM